MSKSDSEIALGIVAKRFNILPPLTEKDVMDKIDEIEKRAIKNLPAKTRREIDGMSQEEIMEKFYSRGDKLD
jgi:hypothetical protein